MGNKGMGQKVFNKNKSFVISAAPGNVPGRKEIIMKHGIMDILVEEINKNLPEGEKVECLRSEPEMECGDGRWRKLNGQYASKEGQIS
jgi:hypothetical protein